MPQYVISKLIDLLEIDSPSGFCHDVIDYVKTEVEELGFTATLNNKGNLEVFVDVNALKTVALSAHVDTLGFMVRSINADGTLNVSALGGPILSTVNGEYCNIHTRSEEVYTGTILNKASAIHVYPDASDKVEIENLVVRIDEKVKSKQDTLDLGIANGDIVAYNTKTEVVGSFIKARFLDDKAGVAILLDLLRQISKQVIVPSVNLLFIFSTYEEVGHGGSHFSVEVDEFIALDMGCVGLDLDGNEYSVSIGAKDTSGPYDYKMTSKLIELATELEIPYAVDIYPRYGSDASAALRAGNNIRAALVGPGINASHGMERTHLEGINATIALLIAYIKDEDIYRR